MTTSAAEPKKVLVAGFQHETNTFAPSKAAFLNFERGEGHPALPRGEEFLALRDVNIPAGGFIKSAEERGWTVIPVVWAGASPSAHVTEDAFERIANEILEAVSLGGFDAVYLDLHGAMVTEHFDDGEGELLARIRKVVGACIPVVASLDLHANVTEQMLESANALVAFRTYPHVDMAETGERCADLLEKLFSKAECDLTVCRLPFLIPINSMCTLLDPAKSMYERVAHYESGQVHSVSFAAGFPAADFCECGPVIWGYGRQASSAVEALYAEMLMNEAHWQVPFMEPEEAVLEAMRILDVGGGDGPVVIADTQDNPGAGADSNTAGMLRALISAGAKNAAIGLMYEPDIAMQAHQAGVGAKLELSFGGKSGVQGDDALSGLFEVVSLSDGACRYDGPMKHGMIAQLGPVAALRIGEITVVVSSTKAQMLERNLYRIAGVQPESMDILVNKSSVHFRADFQGIARAVLVAKAPGPMLADPADLPWKNLKPGMRLKPCGPEFVPSILKTRLTCALE